MPLEISNTPFEVDGSKSSFEMSDGVTVYKGEFVLATNLNLSTTVTYNYVDVYNRSSSVQLDVNTPSSFTLVKSGSATDLVSGDLVVTRLLVTGSYNDPGLFNIDVPVVIVGSGSWTKPDGVTQVIVECWGGGGAGGGANANNNLGGGGGAGGQYSRKLLLYPPASQVIPLVIGAGGVGSTGDGAPGLNTTWNSTEVVALGGAGGLSSTNLGDPGIATTDGAVGDVVYRGNSGQAGNSLVGPTARGGFGGGGPGSAQNGQGNSGGKEWGGSGGSIIEVSAGGLVGDNALDYGAGGSGAAKVSGPNKEGGNGSVGQILIIYR